MRSSAESDAGAGQELAFQIINSGSGVPVNDTIYITSDATYNKVTLQISLTTGRTTLSPGTIPDPDSPPVTGSTIYLDVSQLGIAASAWKSMTFDADGWAFKTFPDQDQIGMTPDGAPIELSSGTAGAIRIGINGIVVTDPAPTPQVMIYPESYNVPGLLTPYASFQVTVMNPPEGDGNLADAIGVALSANGIVNTVDSQVTAANQFSLQFINRQRTVNAGDDTVFNVSFVYGAPHDQYGYGALTDVSRANHFVVTQGDNAEAWAITPDSNAEVVSWKLQPPSGSPIVGTGQQAVVSVDFSNVVTYYQPGPTIMLVSYSGVPGYRDGSFSLVLNKIQHASIGSLSVSPNPTYFSGKSAKVTVRWKATGAQSLELTQNYLTTPVSGKTELPATLDAETTTFVLKATGKAGTAENTDFKTVQAVALPVINSFTGAPTEIYHGSASHEASFDWAVDSTDDVRLSSTGDAFTGQAFRPTDRAPATITEPQMITLTPTTAANPLTLTRRLVISAFKPVPKTYSLDFTPSAAAVSPDGPYVLVAGPGTSLTVLETVEYSTVGTHDLKHTATAIAFSADGTLVATANSDKTVSVIPVTAGPDGMPVFGKEQSISVGGVPAQLVFSPVGPRIYLTVDPGGKAGEVVTLLKGATKWATEGSPVPVGARPCGLTTDAAGARLFVANSGSGTEGTVTQIGITASGKLSGSTDIHGFSGAPTGVAATPSGKQLLVTIAGAAAGSVVVVDPDRPETGQRKSLPIGRDPGQIALLPSGSYAFVPNATDGTVSLVDCWGQPSAARLPGPAIQVGANPRAIAASPDGLQVLIAVDNGLCVLTLSTYEALPEAPPVPDQPTNVAVSPDGRSVFAWHNALFPPPSAITGITVYDTRSRTSTDLLTDQKVISFVTSPSTRSPEAFAIVKDDPAVYRVSLDTLQVNKFTLGLGAGNNPVAAAISGEGQMLYVVTSDASHNLTLVVLEGQAEVWSVIQTLPLYKAAGGVGFLLRSTPDGGTVFLVDVTAAAVRVLRRSGSRYALLPAVIPGDVQAKDLAVLPDGSTGYVLNAGSGNNTVTVIDVASLATHTDAIPQDYVNLTGLQPSPDGRRLFATDTNTAALRMLDPRSLRILETIRLSSKQGGAAGIMALAVQPDGSAIYTANLVSKNISVVGQVQMGTSLLEAAGYRAAAAYEGLFLRHYLKEKPGGPAQGWSESPDAFPYGLNIEPNRERFIKDGGYDKDWGKDVALENPNCVYIRGLNTTATERTTRVYFYYTQGTLAMWPANWRGDNTTVNSKPCNWVDIKTPPNGLGVCDTPLVWTPGKLNPATDHYCIIGWAVEGADPQPPDFAKYDKFNSLEDLVRFIQSHHNMAWRNTHDVLTPPPKASYRTLLQIPEAGGSVYIQIQFYNLPEDGEFAVNVAGSDKSNSVDQPRVSLSRYAGGWSPKVSPLFYEAQWDTSVEVFYWEGKTPVPDTGRIKVTLLTPTDLATANDIERTARLTGRPSPVRSYGNVPVLLIGEVEYKLLFGKKTIQNRGNT